MISKGITINGKHSYRDFGLIMTACEIASPTPNIHLVYIPGRKTPLDLTESLYGDITYENRQIVFEFDHQDSIYSYQTTLSLLNNFFHGQKVKVIIDSDPEWYWEGRMTVSGRKDKKGIGSFTLTMNAEPYKYGLSSPMGEWLWDSFNFCTGVIRNYENMIIPNDKTIKIVGSPTPVTPKIKVSAGQSVTVGEKSWELSANTWTELKGLKIGPEEYDFIFSGSGTASIDFREESL